MSNDEQNRQARAGTMEFGINSQKPGNATDQAAATDLTASAYGKTSKGENVDVYLTQSSVFGSLSTNTGVVIEEAGRKFGVWVTQTQGKPPEISIAEYGADGLAHKDPITVNDPVLGAKLNADVYASAQDAQFNNNSKGTANVPTQDFDKLAADARAALAEAGIAQPSTGRKLGK